MPRIIKNEIVVEIEVESPFFTNITKYKRHHNLNTNIITWKTNPFDVRCYVYNDNEWEIVDNRSKPFVDIPEIEIIYQQLLREKKLKRICTE